MSPIYITLPLREKQQHIPALTMRYIDASEVKEIHHIEGSPGWFISVVGNPSMGVYEWIVSCHGEIEHSDCGYGNCTRFCNRRHCEYYGSYNKPCS